MSALGLAVPDVLHGADAADAMIVWDTPDVAMNWPVDMDTIATVVVAGDPCLAE